MEKMIGQLIADLAKIFMIQTVLEINDKTPGKKKPRPLKAFKVVVYFLYESLH